MTSNKLAEISIFKGATQKIKELSALVQFIQGRPTPKKILEIGTDRGGTFWLWCQLATNDATIVSIDKPDGQFGNPHKPDSMYLKGYKKADQNLHFIKRDSHSKKTEDILTKKLNGGQLDILFIDGDHTYEGVKDDYQRYQKYLSANGLIVFHDIIHHNQVPSCQVELLWEELKQKHSYLEFIDEETDDRGWGSWGGIGVVLPE